MLLECGKDVVGLIKRVYICILVTKNRFLVMDKNMGLCLYIYIYIYIDSSPMFALLTRNLF